MNLVVGIMQKAAAFQGLARKMVQAAVCIGFISPGEAKEPKEAYLSEAISAFYKARNNKPFWFSGNIGQALRQHLLLQLEYCGDQGLDPGRYPIFLLKASQTDTATTMAEIMTADHLYTRTAMIYWKDVLTGGVSNSITGKDALCDREANDDHKRLAGLLGNCSSGPGLDSAVRSLEPAAPEYLLLKSALAAATAKEEAEIIALLKIALNNYRRVHHPGYPKCIVVNIASGLLRYYESDSLKLEMKVVTGKPSTPTPRFSTYCSDIILYPYWNVPRSIAVNEFLPLCKKSPSVLSFLNIQVLDSKGKILDPRKINWNLYNKKNFPYRFRQATGCDNALGVIKFNLESPYGVYLHDTNNKAAFAARKRYFSHGCIRLEKPLELANLLLGRNLESSYLEACLKEERPQVVNLPAPVPVFVVYVRADVKADSSITYYEDVYKLK